MFIEKVPFSSGSMADLVDLCGVFETIERLEDEGI